MNRKPSVAAVAALIVAVGCTAPISTQVNVTDPAPEALRVQSLALLPPTVDPGLEAYGRDAGEALYAALREEYPAVPMVPPAQALERLQNARATTTYANLVAQYEETGRLNAELVRELSEAVGARHLLSLRLAYAEDAGYGPGDFAGELEYEGQGLRVITQLWDGERGVLEWRTVGDVAAVGSDLMRARSVDELIEAIVPDIAALVPIEGGDPIATVPVNRGPSDRTVFTGASGLLLLAFLLL